MKKIVLIALLLWSLPGMAQIKSAHLVASGLTCSMCSKAIYKALEALPAVMTVEADIEHSAYDVVFKPGSDIAPDELKKAVEDAGFFVAALDITVTVSNAAVANDAHINIGAATYHFIDVKGQTLNGDVKLTLVDKNYVPAGVHKKYGRKTSMKCFATGYMDSCCPQHEKGNNKRVYHVTI